MQHPEIDPVLFTIGGLSFYWYGLMYVIGFLGVFLLAAYRARLPGSPVLPASLSDLLFAGFLGVIIGGRLGYVLFYNFSSFMDDPLSIVKVWQGGMSFHGGLLGVLLAVLWFARRQRLPFLAVTDFIAPMVPIGLGAGRIGNFINAELWGRPSDLPWAMVFPQVDALPRHPSQIYEFLLEGLLLFIVLWLFSSRPRRLGMVSGLFAVLYAVFRFSVEFVREPDRHIGYLAWDWLTMGQLLCLPLLVVGLLLIQQSRKRQDMEVGV